MMQLLKGMSLARSVVNKLVKMVISMMINAPFIGSGEIKVIVLGTDPTWKKLIQYRKDNGKEGSNYYIRTAFGLCDEDRKLYKEVVGRRTPLFFNSIEKNLEVINIDYKKSAYICNLIPHEVALETTQLKNKWYNIVNEEHCIDALRKQLSVIDSNMPILVTAKNLTQAIFHKDKKKVDIAKSCYQDFRNTNELYSKELQRYIFPFYRHHSYALTKDENRNYASALYEYINK